jgi:hypothetical protein
MTLQTTIGSAVTVVGVLGIFVSFIIEKSEFDPTAFALSMVSIFIAVVGIALIFQPPAKQETLERTRKRTKPRAR